MSEVPLYADRHKDSLPTTRHRMPPGMEKIRNRSNRKKHCHHDFPLTGFSAERSNRGFSLFRSDMARSRHPPRRKQPRGGHPRGRGPERSKQLQFQTNRPSILSESLWPEAPEPNSPHGKTKSTSFGSHFPLADPQIPRVWQGKSEVRKSTIWSFRESWWTSASTPRSP